MIIADSRWQLQRAIRGMHEVPAELNFTLHPDKTSIGRVEKGFDFLDCRLGLGKLRPASSAADRVLENITRLYEQDADSYRIGVIFSVGTRRSEAVAVSSGQLSLNH